MAEPTRGLTRAASHGVSRRSEDSDPEDQDGYGFPSDPCGVHDTLGVVVFRAYRPAEAGRRPSLRFRAPSETCLRSPAPRGRTSRPKPARGLLRNASSPGLSCPTTHSRTGRSASVTADPSAAACHVRGLDTPFAAYTTSPTDARSVGASMGFALQGVLLVRERCPSRGPCPPDVSALRPTSPRGRGLSDGRLQGLVPATSSCCHRAAEATRPSMPS